jgi:hypothetical protein
MANRRAFLRDAATTTGAIAAGTALQASSLNARLVSGQWPIAIFEKVFEGLTYDELADAIFQIGADGVEATIRPQGHIEPAVAADEVPKMAEAMAKRGKKIVIAATGITRADQPRTESLLATLKSVGITHYRTGYYRYDHRRPMKQQVAEFAAMAKDLAALNRTIGIQGLYQTHAGARYLGALGWDLAYLLDGIDPDALGAAIDLRHVRVDTGSSWKTAVQVLKPHVRSIYVKDAIWTGDRADQLKDVPVDTGLVNKEMFDYVRSGLSSMPLCIHMEHMGYRVFEKHEVPGAIEAHQKDIAALRRWMG